MLRELLRSDPKTFVHAVVQSRFENDASIALDQLEASERARVNVLSGDVAAIDLGLSGKEYRELAGEVDLVHHLARATYLGVEREIAERTNIGGTREVIEFAESCESLRCLVVHSTAHVAGDREGLVREDEILRGQRYRNAVEETMARAEILCERKRHKVPIAVLRPTTIVGDSRTGEVDRFDGPYLLILLIVTSPPEVPLLLPAGRGEEKLHLVPIDYVVRAARAIGKHPKAPGRTFHIGDPAPLSARRVFELVAQAGGKRLRRGFIPANVTKALLRTPGLDRLAKSPRAFLESLVTPVEYSLSGTRELLAGSDLHCPPFESYVDKLVEYVETRLRERRAARDEDVVDPLG